LVYLQNCHWPVLQPLTSLRSAYGQRPYAAGATWPATRRALLAPHLPPHELPQPPSPRLRVELPRTPRTRPCSPRRRQPSPFPGMRPRHPGRLPQHRPPRQICPSSTSPSSLAYKRPTRPSSRAETAAAPFSNSGEPQLTVELLTLAIHAPNQPLKWNPIALLKLSDPSFPSFPHRSMDAGEQTHRRPPLSADPPPPTLSRRATATQR